MRTFLICLSIGLALGLVAAALAASSLSLQEANLEEATPYEIHTGADGKLILSDNYTGNSTIWQIEPASGFYNRFTIYGTVGVLDAQRGPDGNIWFTDGAMTFGHLEPSTSQVDFWDVPGAPGDRHLWGGTFDQDGDFWMTEWFGAKSLLYRFDPQASTLYTYTLSNGSFSYDLQVDDAGLLWLGNWGSHGIYRVDPVNKEATWWSSDVISRPVSLTPDGNGGLWFADAGAGMLAHLNPTTNVLTAYDLPVGISPTMILLRNGLVWYNEEISPSLGVLDPEVAVGITYPLSVTIEGEICEYCEIPYPTGVFTYPTDSSTGTLTWSVETPMTVTLDSNGWTVYALPEGASPYGLASTSGYLWISDQTRGKLLRVPMGYAVYLPLVVR